MYTQAQDVAVIGDPHHLGPKWRAAVQISPLRLAESRIRIGVCHR